MTSTARVISADILGTATVLRAADPTAVPVAFWDFDGTIIEGDCSDGLETEGGQVFPGLVEVAIGMGHSQRFSPHEGFAHCWREYQQVIATDGLAAANAFLVQAFAGTNVHALLELSRLHFREVLHPWFFAEALEIWHAIETAGVRCFVLSASADFFVKGAAPLLNTKEDRFHGIRLATSAGDMLSHELVTPITYGDGKAERMRELLTEMAEAEPAKSFWPVAAFGNHCSTDGPLLEAVAGTSLPAGTPVSVIVNDKAPHRLIREATFRSKIPTLAV